MLERLALEKGWLQLMTLELEYFAENWSRATDDKPGLFLSKADMEVLEKARAILFDAYAAPPDVKTLSRRVGMNHFKLKKGFKQLFGFPPMAYVRNRRMEVARELLVGGTMSVTQVAMEVGYSNPSSFTARFTERFGQNPKDFK